MIQAKGNTPRRIVALTEETTELLYLLGEEKRLVGISAYTVRPPQAKSNHPVVSAFIQGNVEQIVELKPDLVVGFSDIQADLARDLIKRGLSVWITNQRSISEILDMMLCISGILGVSEKGLKPRDDFLGRISMIQAKASAMGSSPRVYFEEWDEPMISGIRWVSEAIGIAGGSDCFSEKSHGAMASDRFLKSEDVVEADPEVMVASWCGKKFKKDSVLVRPKWDGIQAIQEDRIYEMDPSIILQPGPALFLEGIPKLQELIFRV